MQQTFYKASKVSVLYEYICILTDLDPTGMLLAHVVNKKPIMLSDKTFTDEGLHNGDVLQVCEL